MNVSNQLDKDLEVAMEKDLKVPPFTKPVSSTGGAMAKATTIVKLDQTIEDLRQNIDEMQAMIRVVEEIKKRLV